MPQGQPPHLRRLLIQAAHGAKLKRDSFCLNKFKKLKFKLGSANKAKVAIANQIARAIYKVLGGSSFKDLGYCRAIEHKVRIVINQLKALGVDVRLEGHHKVVSVKKTTRGYDGRNPPVDALTQIPRTWGRPAAAVYGH